MRRLCSAWLVCLLCWLAGCATPQLSRLSQERPADLPPVAEVRQVPFLPQEDFHCGPAALAMVAQFAGVSVTPEDLAPQVYLPERLGSLQIEMLAAARRQGLVALTLRPQLEDLLRQVAAGHPVVVLQNLSLPVAPLWHYAVVTGYDLPAQTLRLHSGLNPHLVMPLSTFERTWARGQHWAMLALAPERLPAQAQALPWLQAVAALARVQPVAAHRAYATATQRWPEHAPAWLALGNAAYHQGQLQEAGQAFEAATRRDPELADAWHNLAQVRLEQGRWSDAAQAAERAVSLGGPRLARYRELQRRVLHGPPAAPS